MTLHQPITPAPNGIAADARTVSPVQFIEAVLPGFEARRQAWREHDRHCCIRAIKAGSTYGFPPVLVDECRALIAADMNAAVIL